MNTKEQTMDPDDNYDFDLEAGEDFADGWDGQPDEYTEWMDFDPDC
jgi:hypothetical protein